MGFGPKYRKSRPNVKVAMQTIKFNKDFGFTRYSGRMIYQNKKTYEAEVEEVIEPIISCKDPIIASGATPIGSAEHTPDEQLFQKENGCRNQEGKDEIYSIVRITRLKKKK
jgi:hypothetical protein